MAKNAKQLLLINEAVTVEPLKDQFQSITFNLKASKAKTRHDEIDGRDHLVVPCVMLTEGVHAGSQGPLYYPEDELKKWEQSWDHKPIVVYHPERNGAPVTAVDPDVLTKQRVGVLMDTRTEDGKLKSECWLDVEKTREVDDRVLEAVESEQMMELSTGLFTDNEPVGGEWDGKEYGATARNFRPDHLALLPDKIGACSIADGAGLLRNEMSHSDLRDKLDAKVQPPGDEARSVWVMEVWDDFFIYEQGDQVYHQRYTVAEDEVNLEGVRQPVVRKVQYELPDGTLVGNIEEEPVDNAVMKTDGGRQYPAAAYAYVPDPQKPSTWKLRLWETPDKKVTAAQVGRAIAAIGRGFRGQRVQLPADAVAGVKRKIRAAWRQANPDKEATDMPSVLSNEKKEVHMWKDVVDDLIANADTSWTEEDRERLMGLEGSFEVLQAKEEEGVGEEEKPKPKAEGEEQPGEEQPPAENEEPVTLEAYITNAPPELQGVLVEGIRAHDAQKTSLISKITANERNTFTPEQLQAKGLDELRAMAILAEVPEAETKPRPSWAGMAPVAPITNEGAEEPLLAPALFDN